MWRVTLRPLSIRLDDVITVAVGLALEELGARNTSDSLLACSQHIVDVEDQGHTSAQLPVRIPLLDTAAANKKRGTAIPAVLPTQLPAEMSTAVQHEIEHIIRLSLQAALKTVVPQMEACTPRTQTAPSINARGIRCAQKPSVVEAVEEPAVADAPVHVEVEDAVDALALAASVDDFAAPAVGAEGEMEDEEVEATLDVRMSIAVAGAVGAMTASAVEAVVDRITSAQKPSVVDCLGELAIFDASGVVEYLTHSSLPGTGVGDGVDSATPRTDDTTVYGDDFEVGDASDLGDHHDGQYDEEFEADEPEPRQELTSSDDKPNSHDINLESGYEFDFAYSTDSIQQAPPCLQTHQLRVCC